MADKICKKCKKDIIYGVNGCMLMDECFDCHGGLPKYAPARKANRYSWDELDALEDKCIGGTDK